MNDSAASDEMQAARCVVEVISHPEGRSAEFAKRYATSLSEMAIMVMGASGIEEMAQAALFESYQKACLLGLCVGYELAGQECARENGRLAKEIMGADVIEAQLRAEIAELKGIGPPNGVGQEDSLFREAD